MNSKRSKRKESKGGKKRVKTKPANGEAEVFVLPPQLLKKLGINLANVDKGQECPTEATYKDETSIDTILPVLPQYNVDADFHNTKPATKKDLPGFTTILETASLMKESVFLSPTFHDINNATLEEINNVSREEECNINPAPNSINGEYRENNLLPEEDTIVIPELQLNTIPTISAENKCGNIFNKEEIHAKFEKSKAEEKTTPTNNDFTDLSSTMTRASSTDDHPDEAYLSDCSNLGSLEIVDGTNYIPDTISMGNEKKHKINILSEEILDSLQIKELKSLHSTKPSNLFPVSINSVILMNNPNKNTLHNVASSVSSDFNDLEIDNVLNPDNVYDSQSLKNCKTIVLYDEQGNALETVSSHENPGLQGGEIKGSDFLIVNDTNLEITSNAYDTETYDREKLGAISENNLGVSIDFTVTDIEMHLKENEETLVTFVNEITSNDNDSILVKKKKSEEDNFIKQNRGHTELFHCITNDNSYVTQTRSQKSIDVISLTDWNKSLGTSECIKTVYEDAKVSDTIIENEIIESRLVESEIHAINNSEKFEVIEVSDKIMENETIESRLVESKVLASNNSENYEVAVVSDNIMKNENIESMFDEPEILGSKTTENFEDTEVNNTIMENKNIESRFKEAEMLASKNTETVGGPEVSDNFLENENIESRLNESEILASKNTENFKGTEESDDDESMESENIDSKFDESGILASDKTENFEDTKAGDKVLENEYMESRLNESEVLASKNTENFKGTEVSDDDESMESENIDSKFDESGILASDKTENFEDTKASDKVLENANMESRLNESEKLASKNTENFKGTEVSDDDESMESENIDSRFDESEILASDKTENFEDTEASDKVLENESIESILNESEMLASKNTENFEETELCDGILENENYSKMIASKDTGSYQQHGECVDQSTIPKDLVCDRIVDVESNNETIPTENERHVHDKIKEIAGYLRQFAEIKKSRKIKFKISARTKLLAKAPKETALKTKFCIQGVEEPGGSDQFEEKKSIPNTLKTYTRTNLTNKNRQTATLNVLVKGKGPETSNTANIEIDDLSLIRASECTKTEDFCFCGDFGKLEHWESDVIYEHIHFWDHETGDDFIDSIDEEIDESKQNKINTPVTTGRRICWNSFYAKNAIEDTNKKNLIHSSSDKSNDKIGQSKKLVELSACRNVQDENIESRLSDSFLLRADDSNPSSKNTESSALGSMDKCGEQVFPVSLIHIQHYQSSSENVLEQTRDNSMIRIEQSDLPQNLEGVTETNVEDSEAQNSQLNLIETEEPPKQINPKKKSEKRLARSIKVEINEADEGPPIKKTIKCAVCETILGEAEWEEHASKAHNYIAWKSGSSFDTKEPKLLEKCKAILNDKGILNCPFCSTGFNKVKKFLKHVRNCLKDSSNSTHNTDESPVVNIKEKDYPVSSDVVKCAICKEDVHPTKWLEHIEQMHRYLAWKQGETPLFLDNKEDIRVYLNEILKEVGELKCSKCGIIRKYAKAFQKHMQTCQDTRNYSKDSSDSVEIATNDSEINTISDDTEMSTDDIEMTTDDAALDKCGVCGQYMQSSQWFDHIQTKHEYMAWKDGDEPLDAANEDQVWQHLLRVSKACGTLVCNECGCERKYPKAYLHHKNTCKGPVDKVLDPVKCGVCQAYLQPSRWFEHIQTKHDYLAWKEGESLDLNDKEAVYTHLYEITQTTGGLKCSKCGLVRKYVKSYQSHIENCDETRKLQDTMGSSDQNSEVVVCAVCSEEVPFKNWFDHKMKEHYNVAWCVGETPIDYKSPSIIERFIREYREHNKKMVCQICQSSRASNLGFYAHVIACGKTEEELDIHRNMCNICNKKYLWVYHNQHMKMHVDQDLAKERKKELQSKIQRMDTEKVESKEVVSGKRKAAQKARNVIEKYKKDSHLHTCSKCQFGTDDKDDLSNHICKTTEPGDDSDSEDSVNMRLGSENESEDSDIDSAVSEEEEEEVESAKKRHRENSSISYKLPRFLSEPANVNAYLVKSGEEFYEFHFTSDQLFSEWRQNIYEVVPDDKLSTYMPALTESCKLKTSGLVWTTLKQFESKKEKGRNQTMFVGACIQAVSWAPLVSETHSRHYLAVLCHRDSDPPRLPVEPTLPQPGLIQIWDFGGFNDLPQFALGLAHNFGIAWAMDWCPSGASDRLSETPGSNSAMRLGLLAVAFSTGCAYIFSIPYPSTVVKNDKLLYKLKPVAELRLTMGSNRKLYQATCISWSPQKNHDCVLVGYGDGTTAYFDLNTDSPFLKDKENDVTVFYPYHDERPHATCITGVGVYPSADPASLAGAVCVSSSTGASLLARPGRGAGAARQATHIAASGVRFEPLWPGAALAGDDAGLSMAPNELEWFSGGRRVGCAGVAATCARCGRVALHAAPMLRLVRPHPVVPDYKKHMIGLLHMTPLGKKRSKLKNDELQIKVEPITYEEAIKKYGVELKTDKEIVSKQSVKGRLVFPERFPLAEVTSMAFCPSATHHGKLLVATHAGIMFLLNV